MYWLLIKTSSGEVLPDFSSLTHSGFSRSRYLGLLPFVAPLSVLNSIPADAPNNRNFIKTIESPESVWNPNELMQCIMTGGGKNSRFYDGSRMMTPREVAACQGFPHHYEFHGDYERKQIGNSVAPIFAKALYNCVRKSLEKSDAMTAAEHDAGFAQRK